MSNYQNYSSNSNFDQLNSNISTNIYKIRQNTNQFVQLGKQLGSAKDNETLRKNIHEIFQTTNELIKQTSVNLKRLSSFKSTDCELATSKSKRAFETEVENYSRLQKEVSEKLRRIAPANDLINLQANEGTSSGDEAGERSTLLKQKKLSDLDMRIDLIKDRETKVKQIESDILDINSIMRDLAGMVNEQTSLIDNISSNVESTASHVDNANSQLIQANKYAGKYRKKVLILILIIMVILTALGLTLYFTLKK